MKRRTVLTAFTTGMLAFAGCASETDSDEWNYRTTCDRMIIPYRNLPDNAREEVDTAFTEGEYETEGNLYYELLLEDIEQQYLVRDRTYYLAEIDETKERSTLKFRETTPSFESPHPIKIQNETGERLDFTFTIGTGEGSMLTEIKAHERQVVLEPEEVYHTDGIIDEFGTYTVRLEFDDGRSEEDEFTVGNYKNGHVYVETSISSDGVSAGNHIGADDGSCPWAYP